MDKTAQEIKEEYDRGDIDIGQAAIQLHCLGYSADEIWEILGINPYESEE